MIRKLRIYTDGGAIGNPGPAGIAFIIQNSKSKIQNQSTKQKVLCSAEHINMCSGSKYIGVATNNQAEYKALIFALEKAKELKAEEINCYLDSELVVNQLNLKYKIKNRELGLLFVKVWNLIQEFKKVRFHYIPREKNKEADYLVGKAIKNRN